MRSMLGYRSGGDLPLEAINARTGSESVGQGHGVANRLGARPAVPDDSDAGDAEKRRAAVLGIIDATAEMTERAARQHRADPHGDGARQLFTQQVFHHLDEPLADLERHIPGKTVAD